MNTLKIGIIYHVVDKTTGKVIKVGSTTQTLRRRFTNKDYKKKYLNHFLLEVRVIKSSEFDWYDKINPYCPFLWHLVAAEHLEILKQGTLKFTGLSNRVSPLDQKFFGLDSAICSSIGGKVWGPIQGRRNVENGRMSEMGKIGGKLSGIGRRNAESGQTRALGYIQGKKNVDSGFLASLRTPEHQSKAGREGGKIGGPKTCHIRWHVNRGIVNPNCPLCVFASN